MTGLTRQPLSQLFRLQQILRTSEQHLLLEPDMRGQQFGEPRQIPGPVLRDQSAHFFVFRQGALYQSPLAGPRENHQKSHFFNLEMGFKFGVEARHQGRPRGSLVVDTSLGGLPCPTCQHETGVVITGQLSQRRVSFHSHSHHYRGSIRMCRQPC